MSNPSGRRRPGFNGGDRKPGCTVSGRPGPRGQQTLGKDQDQVQDKCQQEDQCNADDDFGREIPVQTVHEQPSKAVDAQQCADAAADERRADQGPLGDAPAVFLCLELVEPKQVAAKVAKPANKARTTRTKKAAE